MKFRLKHTKLQFILEGIALVVLIGMYAYLILRWNYLPDRIPGHYNFAGEVDRWGDKGELVFLPVVTTFLYLLLTVVTFFPSAWNIPVKITDSNRDKVYGTVKNMLILMKIEIMMIFFYILQNSVNARAISPYFLPVFLIVIFGTIAFFLTKTIRAGKK